MTAQANVKTWASRISELEDGIAWLEQAGPQRVTEFEEMRRRLSSTKAKMRAMHKRPSSPLTFADRAALA